MVYKDDDVRAVRNDHGEVWEVGVRSSKRVVWGTGRVDREERTSLRERAAGRWQDLWVSGGPRSKTSGSRRRSQCGTWQAGAAR